MQVKLHRTGSGPWPNGWSLDEASLSSRRVPADEQPAADQAERQLRRGIEKSRRIVANYRRQLARLALSSGAAERPLFKWRKE